jgi:hypothetical protein
MSKLEKALREFRDANSFKSKGQLAVALHITRFAKSQGLPLDAETLVTEKNGQVAGLSKSAVQAVLKDYGIVRVLAEEGGRTSRGSLGNMRNYVAFLNQLRAKKLADLDAIETWWIGAVKEYFNSQPFTLRYDPTKSLGSMMSDLLEQAIKRQKDTPGATLAGTMLQHLVGAKLDLILPEDKRPKHDSASTADASAAKAGDFVIDTMAIHVTTAPSEALMRKCRNNLDNGLWPLIVTLADSRAGAEVLAKNQGIRDRIDIIEAEQFIATNIMEWGYFSAAPQRQEVERLINRYNEIIEMVETDWGLKIS